MQWPPRVTSIVTICALTLACSDDTGTTGTTGTTDTTTNDTSTTADEDATETSASMGDGDGDPGDGDGDPGDGEPGDGDPGDGDPGDGDPGDGDPGDGDPGDICGDGMITGSEACDDGVNDGSYGGCSMDCLSLAPHCGDATVNGPEACDDANVDLDDGCLDNCTIPETCLSLYQYDDMLANGVYLIAPPGWMDDPFPAYCDMDEGGWTLTMRFAPMGSDFHFYSPRWTDTVVVNENTLDPLDPSDAKFPAYEWVPGTEIRGCLENPQDQSVGCKAYALPMASTLLELFTTVPVGSDATMQGLYFQEAQQDKLDWLTIQGRSVNEASITPNYIEVGINIDDDQSCYDARVRFGLVLNNENNISTLNDAAGFGAQAYYTVQCDLQPMEDSGWRTASGFAAGPNIYETLGQIWVR